MRANVCDIIAKILYVKEGYLPNIPYHLISDKEMVDAFIYNQYNYFDDNYPCLCETLRNAYDKLKQDIRYHLDQYLSDSNYILPDWVYSYMIGSVISINSDELDIGDLMSGMYLNRSDPVFDSDLSQLCYKVSSNWVKRLPLSDKIGNDSEDHRPPTMFGEPHVIKSIRLYNSNYSGS